MGKMKYIKFKLSEHKIDSKISIGINKVKKGNKNNCTKKFT